MFSERRVLLDHYLCRCGGYDIERFWTSQNRRTAILTPSAGFFCFSRKISGVQRTFRTKRWNQTPFCDVLPFPCCSDDFLPRQYIIFRTFYYKKQIFKYKNGQNTHFFGETIGVQKMKARRHPTSVRRPPEERGGTGEKCVAVRLAERLAAVSGGTCLESRGLFPGRAAVKLLHKGISIRRKTAT